MKGMELPINMIIIIAIAMLILVVVGAYFSGAFGGTSNAISLENAFSQACSQLVSAYNCDTQYMGTIKVNYKPSGSATALSKSLTDLCILKGVDMTTLITCARLCGCA